MVYIFTLCILQVHEKITESFICVGRTYGSRHCVMEFLLSSHICHCSLDNSIVRYFRAELSSLMVKTYRVRNKDSAAVPATPNQRSGLGLSTPSYILARLT